MAEGARVITVLHVIDTGGPGGAETVFLSTSSGLDPSRFRALCVVAHEGWLADALRARGVQPIIIPANGSLEVRYVSRLLEIVRRERVDVIVGHLYGSAIYCSIAGALSRTPVVSVLHGQHDVPTQGRFALAKRLLVRFGSRAVVFVSNKLKEELASVLSIPPERCELIPNGVDASKFNRRTDGSLREELKLAPTDVLVGAVGNIRAPKSYEVLLRAAHLLRQRSPKYRFVIAGEGGNALHNELLALRSELRLETDVFFLGLRTDVDRVLHSLDVFALSSSAEGFSIACIEAMAAGVPVVATRSGGPQDIIEHEVSGLLVPVRDPVALADGIERLANDTILAQQISLNALQRVHELFTLEAMLSAYERLFENIAFERIHKRRVFSEASFPSKHV
jgi:glycosyltransferase involved in cell wall biosynthesis